MKNVLPSIAEMHRAFRESDPSYDGVFFSGVKTTSIFCRPSCPARKPLPENIEFFGSAREALFAGYRPCKRCRPLDPIGQPPQWMRELLTKIDAAPTERMTASDLCALGVDPARARRHFLKQYGLTFHEYCRSRRLGHALEQIRRGADLDEVALDHAYESNSGFRTAFAHLFGKPPGRGREAECIVAAWIETPFGPMIAGATADGICLLEFTDRRMLESQLAALRRRLARAVVPGRNPHIDRLKHELGEYFEGERTDFSVPLIYPGTPFQCRVWKDLLRIPYGQTRSYEELAQAIGSPQAVRAVGRANGQNRIAILIPCHRVVNKSGELGGYGGGVWRKQRLLELEGGGKMSND